jgi:hypothetical protein
MIEKKDFLKIETKLFDKDLIEKWNFVIDQIRKDAILNNNLSEKEITERTHITQAEYLRMIIKKLYLNYKNSSSKVYRELLEIQESIVLDKINRREKCK